MKEAGKPTYELCSSSRGQIVRLNSKSTSELFHFSSPMHHNAKNAFLTGGFALRLGLLIKRRGKGCSPPPMKNNLPCPVSYLSIIQGAGGGF